MTRLLTALSLGAALVACGGTVVFEEDGGRGDGGAGDGDGSTTTASSTNGSPVGGTGGGGPGPTSASAATAGGSSTGSVVASASTGTVVGCTTHEECGDGNLCQFFTGECVRACEADSCDSCGPGFVCDSCASSSCPQCADCRGGCVATVFSRCDDDDRCPDGQACNFFTGTCQEACLPDGSCATPGTICDPCATSSCCNCDGCGALCVGTE